MPQVTSDKRGHREDTRMDHGSLFHAHSVFGDFCTRLVPSHMAIGSRSRFAVRAEMRN